MKGMMEFDFNADSVVRDQAGTAVGPRLKQLRDASEDFEWYPTTDEIISRVAADIEREMAGNYRQTDWSVIDIGAGDGRVLSQLKARCKKIGSLYAIEKSQTHRQGLDPEVFIMGVDFKNVTLLDKRAAIIFCNPPYSEYEEWAAKILKEAAADTLIYLILPTRWADTKLLELIDSRESTSMVIGTFDFENADRKARARVDIVRVKIKNHYYGEDPFDTFFDETFRYPDPPKRKEEGKAIPNQEQIVNGESLLDTLCRMYAERMQQIESNYTAVCGLDYMLLDEFGISKKSLIESLKQKIEATKKEYWGRLLGSIRIVTERLTSDSRKILLDRLQRHTGIEFNYDNAVAVLEWVLKNASVYLDDQFVTIYERLMERVNIENYVSNRKVFEEQKFTYRNDDLEHRGKIRLKVGHRIVLERCGGLMDPYSWQSKKELSERAAIFIGDLITIGNNLGFRCRTPRPEKGAWNTSDAHEFRFGSANEPEVLFDVRAFLNGNIHIRFHPPFVHAMNIKYGRLKGWITSEEEAAKELAISSDEATKYYERSFRFTGGPLALTA